MNRVFGELAAIAFAASQCSLADAVLYEGDVLPEDAGFTRVTYYDPERWLDDGWFFQRIDQGGGSGGPYDGDYDDYRWDIAPFSGSPFFLEWRLLTDAPNSEVDWHHGGAIVVVYGGGVNFHFNMASGLALILRGYPYPTLYFDIQPGVPHTYRLEVYGGDYFEFRIDGTVMDSGTPEAPFPNPYAELIFGALYYQSSHTSRWDYVRFGTIPEPGTGMLLLTGAVWLFGRRRRVC